MMAAVVNMIIKMIEISVNADDSSFCGLKTKVFSVYGPWWIDVAIVDGRRGCAEGGGLDDCPSSALISEDD